MTHPDDSAFSTAGFYDPYNIYVSGEEGLTKREYFAAMAMQGYLVNNAKTGIKDDEISRWSVEAADSLMQALNK
jgi:hypothetical protein